MPIGRYTVWVGTALLALLFVTNWFLPQSLAEPIGDEIGRPVIRIASIKQPPERIIIDTSLPMIVPPTTVTADAIPDEPSRQVQTYASINPHASVNGAEKKKSKAKKKQGNQPASKHPLPAPAIVAASSSPTTTTIAPPTKLSFASIISGQLVRDLFNLH